MYKVFVDNSCVQFKKSEKFSTNIDENFLPHLEPEKFNDFRQYLNKYSKETHFFISSIAPEETIRTFFSRFQWIEAAGGIVQQDSCCKHLFIFRNGNWDLPKGKIELNESPEEASIREVQEECGLQHVRLGNPLPATYHVYHAYNKFWIKKTYWFEMTSSETTLTPQKEEGISLVKWLDTEEIKKIRRETYANLHEVIDAAI